MTFSMFIESNYNNRIMHFNQSYGRKPSRDNSSQTIITGGLQMHHFKRICTRFKWCIGTIPSASLIFSSVTAHRCDMRLATCSGGPLYANSYFYYIKWYKIIVLAFHWAVFGPCSRVVRMFVCFEMFVFLFRYIPILNVIKTHKKRAKFAQNRIGNGLKIDDSDPDPKCQKSTDSPIRFDPGIESFHP